MFIQVKTLVLHRQIPPRMFANCASSVVEYLYRWTQLSYRPGSLIQTFVFSANMHESVHYCSRWCHVPQAHMNEQNTALFYMKQNLNLSTLNKPTRIHRKKQVY